MESVPEMRANDRLLQRTAEQMAAASPQRDLALAAQDAAVPLKEAQLWFADNEVLSAAVTSSRWYL